MRDIAVAIGAYSSYRSAALDWDALDLDPTLSTVLVDGTVIEWRGDRVECVRTILVRHGWGYGAIASAVVAALWPPALTGGAIAGGVGDRVLTCFSDGLSAGARDALSGVLRQGMMATIIVANEPDGSCVARSLRRNAMAVSMAHLPMTSEELLVAARQDAVEASEA